jgi:hypothetical protein
MLGAQEKATLKVNAVQLRLNGIFILYARYCKH